ncbi:MAG: DUF4124 domain-containing protein [Usitatibacter sp.]
MTARLHGAICAIAIFAANCPDVLAQQVLYKWIDDSGKTQYSDKPPKNFKGEVTRIETDVNPPPVVVPRKAESAKGEAAATDKPPADALAQKRAKRAELEANLARARENLDNAKKALAETSDPQPDEVQVIQNRVDRSGTDGAQVARSNCRQVTGQDGKARTICPGVVPSPAYYERIQQLEEAVRKAEEALAAAEGAYRRGVD